MRSSQGAAAEGRAAGVEVVAVVAAEALGAVAAEEAGAEAEEEAASRS
jgi:hypothetical protein